MNNTLESSGLGCFCSAPVTKKNWIRPGAPLRGIRSISDRTTTPQIPEATPWWGSAGSARLVALGSRVDRVESPKSLLHLTRDKQWLGGKGAPKGVDGEQRDDNEGEQMAEPEART